MTDTPELSYADLVLPSKIVSRLDVARLASELERIDGEMAMKDMRTKVGKEGAALNVLHSDRLDAFLIANNLSLKDGRQRDRLIKQVHILKDKVPVIHMTFAVEADPESLGQLAEWVRASIHPQAVIAVGIQPGLVAGVYVRTPNHIHDLSLRGKLSEGHEALVKELEVVNGRG
ncbi:MAG TPA: hypothetical protein VGE34_03840 [Candidatus Saccharimonadales bacterium]